MRVQGVGTIVEVKNLNSFKLMGWVASKLLASPETKVIALVAHSREGWSDLVTLAEECGHSTLELALVDPRLN